MPHPALLAALITQSLAVVDEGVGGHVESRSHATAQGSKKVRAGTSSPAQQFSCCCGTHQRSSLTSRPRLQTIFCIVYIFSASPFSQSMLKFFSFGQETILKSSCFVSINFDRPFSDRFQLLLILKLLYSGLRIHILASSLGVNIICSIPPDGIFQRRTSSLSNFRSRQRTEEPSLLTTATIVLLLTSTRMENSQPETRLQRQFIRQWTSAIWTASFST